MSYLPLGERPWGWQGDGSNLSVVLHAGNRCSHGHPQKFSMSLLVFLSYLLSVKAERSFGVVGCCGFFCLFLFVVGGLFACLFVSFGVFLGLIFFFFFF